MSPFDFLRFKRHNLGGAPDILQFRPKIPLFTVKTAIVGSNSNTSRTSGEREMEDPAVLLKWLPTGEGFGLVSGFWLDVSPFRGCLRNGNMHDDVK